jgi:hypothetical protein
MEGQSQDNLSDGVKATAGAPAMGARVEGAMQDDPPPTSAQAIASSN